MGSPSDEDVKSPAAPLSSSETLRRTLRRAGLAPTTWTVLLTAVLAPTFGLIPRHQLIHLYNWTGSEGLARCADLQGSFLVANCEWAGHPAGYFVYENIVTKSLARGLGYLPGVEIFDAWQFLGIVYLALGIRACIAISRILTGDNWPGTIAALCYFAGGSINSNPGLNQVFHGSALLPVTLWGLLILHRNSAGRPMAPLILGGYSLASGLVLVNVFGYAFMHYSVIAIVITLVVAAAHLWGARSGSGLTRRDVFWSAGVSGSVIIGFGLVSMVQRRIWPTGGVTVSDIRFLRGTSNDLLGLVLPGRNNRFWSWTFDVADAIGRTGQYGSRTPFLGLAAMCLTLVAILAVLRRRSTASDTSGSAGRRFTLAIIIALIATIVFSLGPSLRVADPWPAQGSFTNYNSRLMPASAALVDMPWSSLFEKWGLGTGRVVSRWSIPTALLISITASVGLRSAVRRISRTTRPMGRRHLGATAVVALVAIIWVVESARPSLEEDWSNYRNRRSWIVNYQDSVLEPLEAAIPPGSLVLHLPSSNDYLSPSVGPMIGQRVYNVGGDKNRTLAREVWPYQVMDAISLYQKFEGEVEEATPGIRSARADVVLSVLLDDIADAVVLNHFSLRTAGYGFPPARKHVETWSATAAETARELADVCHIQELPYSTVISDCSL